MPGLLLLLVYHLQPHAFCLQFEAHNVQGPAFEVTSALKLQDWALGGVTNGGILWVEYGMLTPPTRCLQPLI
jgi:hypothetical protein